VRTRCPLAAVVLLFFSLPPQSHAQHATPNNLQFAPPIFIHYPGSYPQAIASGDYNNDGIPDLVVGAEYGDAAVKLGRGNGTFGPWWPGIGTSYVSVIAMGRFNGNDKGQDVVLNDYSDGWAEGHGHAAFLDAGGNFVTSFAVGDFNGDGNQDIAALADIPGPFTDSSTVYLYLGNGDGTFQPPSQFQVSLAPVAILAGDFNGDGKLDLAVLSWYIHSGAGTVSVLLGDGKGGFGSPLVYHIPRLQFWTAITLGDFNGDHNLDLAFTDAEYNSNQSYSVRILLGNGDGTFREGCRGREGQVINIASADFNWDGIPDLVATKVCPAKLGQFACISILLGNGDGTFQHGVNFREGGQATQLTVADFNGDGKPDVAAVNVLSQNVSVLLNTTQFNPKPKPTSGRAP